MPGEGSTSERTVLFVCVENACRSLMAEAFFNAQAPRGWRATSGGTQPAREPNPRTRAMLEEVGVPLPPHPPHKVTAQEASRASLTISMGCLDEASCPAFLGRGVAEDWGIRDPAPLDDHRFREVRDELRALVRELVDRLVREPR